MTLKKTGGLSQSADMKPYHYQIHYEAINALFGKI